MKPIPLVSERLLLKPLSLEHLTQDYVDWMNDPDVIRYLESGGNYTLEMLKEYLMDVEKKEILFWAIHKKDDHLHIGNIKIDPINIRHGIGEYGIMMGRKSEWGKGYAEEATRLILNYSFEHLGLRKITLGVISKNKAAFNLYLKIGFELEGIYKKQGIYAGEYCDAIRMAIFNPDFNERLQ
ncbi:MAG TPA: GNAT family protein [Bacteroidales bacterium]|nr:GNAT family protein [Bacteroidales bacterium]